MLPSVIFPLKMFQNFTFCSGGTVCLHVWVTCALDAHGGLQRATDALKLELYPYSCEALCGFWELNLGPSGRTTSALNPSAISPAEMLDRAAIGC